MVSNGHSLGEVLHYPVRTVTALHRAITVRQRQENADFLVMVRAAIFSEGKELTSLLEKLTNVRPD